jgi:two-component system, NtrC family, response regulator HydG
MSENNMLNLDSSFVALLLDSMADGVFVLDEDGKISIWNRAMEAITGYREEEVISKSCELLSFDL